MKYAITISLKQALSDEHVKALMDRYIPGFAANAAGNPAAMGLSVETLAKYCGVSSNLLAELDAALREYGSVAGCTDEEKSQMEAYRQIAEQDAAKAAGDSAVKPKSYDAFYPGRVWLDTDGKRIQAHGGALFYEGGTYYWYGENKEHTDGKSDIWTWGIRMYGSEDLYNWTDMGLIIPPVLDDPDDNLFPDKHIDRPHIRKSKTTGKYVAWIKLSGAEACFLIMQADRLSGPYTKVKENYRPFDRKVGDFDIIENPKSGKHYLFMDGNHNGIFGMWLSDDLLSAEEIVSTQYEDLHAPFTREGIAMCHNGGSYYMLTSGMSGYLPNQSDCASSDSLEKSFVSEGDPYACDDSMASFNSQFTQVFRIPEKDTYIVLADRWVPRYPMNRQRADRIMRCIAMRYDPEHYQATEEELREFMASPMIEKTNTSIADYVWLPASFENGRPVIRWHDRWTI